MVGDKVISERLAFNCLWCGTDQCDALHCVHPVVMLPTKYIFMLGTNSKEALLCHGCNKVRSPMRHYRDYPECEAVVLDLFWKDVAQ